MRVIFLGPPAAGKGTQAKLVSEKTELPLIVMGDILASCYAPTQRSGAASQKIYRCRRIGSGSINYSDHD